MEVTEVARRITREMVHLLGADLGGVWLADGSQPPAGYHLPKDRVERLAGIPASVWHSLIEVGDGPPGAMYSSRSRHDPRFDHPGLALLDHEAILVLPMRLDGATVGGMVAVWAREPHDFPAAELRLAEALADRGAIAIENARLYEEAERGRREVETVAVLARNINASLELNVVLERVVEAARDLCGSDTSRIALWDPESKAMIFRYSNGARTGGFDGRPITPGQGAGGQVLLTGRPFRTDDYRRDARISKDYVELIEREGTVALMVVPVRSETRVEGLLYVGNRSTRGFSDRDEGVLLRLADHAAIAIRNAGMHAESEARRVAAEALASVGRVVSQSLDADEVAKRVVESVRDVCVARMAGLYRLESASGDLILMAGVGAGVDWNRVLPRGTATVGVAVRERQPIVTGDLLEDPRMTFTPETRARIERSPYRAVLAVPLMIQERVIGVLVVGDRAGRLFGEEAIRLAQSLADQAAIAVENARLFREAHSAKEEIEALAGVGRELTQTLDLDEVLGLTLQQALFLAEADVAYIALTQEDGVARSVACRGQWTSALGNILVRPGSGIAGLALATGEMQESAGEVGELWEPVACEDVRAALVVPLRLARRTVGLLWLGRRAGVRFSEQTKTRLQALSLWLAAALDNARLYQEIALKKTELEAANTSLGETLQIQTEFLSNTSHELRTPLVSIMGLLDAISSGLCTSRDEERTFVAQAHTCAEELLGLINNILDMAKISAGRIELDPSPVDLAEIFEQVRSLVQGQLATKPDLRLHFHPPAPEHGSVPADPDRLKQVLVNLVGNSLKFTDQGEVTVQAVPRPEAGFMTIQVIDTGIGIPLDGQARLFRKFVQADGSTSRKHGGTGLGLAISKHLVEMMGGVIALESRGLGHGTTVTLSLPLGHPSAAIRGEPVPEPWAIQGPNETPLVLVVDDNADCRSLVRDVLHAEGRQTVEAATADEGFEMAVRLRPALVIADLALSCSESAMLRNGVDLVTALARKPGLEGVPAILLTGAPAEGRALLRNVETTAPVHLLEKPLGIGELRAAVDQALQAGSSRIDR